MPGGFGGMGSQRGMASRAERGGGSAKHAREDPIDPSKKKLLRVWDQLPEIWGLMRPRRGLLAVGLGANGDQPRIRPGDSLHDEISDRQCDDPPPDAAFNAAGRRRAAGHAGAGRDFVHADANAIQGGAADDHRAAQKSAGARRASSGGVLRLRTKRARSFRAS